MSICEQSVLARLPGIGVKALREFLFSKSLVWTSFVLPIMMSRR